MGRSGVIRFLVRLAYFAPLVAALLVVNWACTLRPVRRIFSGTLEDAAEALVEGKTIASEADMRDLKPIWIEHWHDSPEVVVLGSSRVAQIPGDWFRPRRMANLAMLFSDFADSVAILEECLDNGHAPKLVVLELNPTLTFEQNSAAPALAPHFRRALLRYGIFSPALLWDPLTLDAVRWDPLIFLRRKVWAVSDQIAGGYRMRPDGSADWFLTEAHLTPAQAEQNALREMHNFDPAHRRWRTSSQPAWLDHKILLAFLDDMRARGIRVVVLLVPVHPAAYDYYRRQGGYDESWIRSDMAGRGVTVIGSFSPMRAMVTRDDFFDDVHPHAAVLRRLLRAGGIIE